MIRKPLFIVLFVLFLTGCNNSPDTPEDWRGSGPDSLYSFQHIRSISFDRPEEALSLLDTAERMGNVNPRDADFFRANIYYNPLQDDERAYRYALQAYRSEDPDGVSDTERMEVLELLCRITAIREQFQEGISYAAQGLKLAVEGKDSRYEGSFLFQMGDCMLRIGQRESGYRNLRSGIELLEKEKDPKVLPTLSFAYGELMVALMDEGRYEEAIAEGKKREECILKLERLDPDIPEGRIDQQKAYLYAKMADFHARAGKMEEAEQYENLFLETSYSQLPQGRILLAEYCEATEQWKRLVDLYGGKDYLPATDTITENVIYYLSKKAHALHHLGRDGEAYDIMERIGELCSVRFRAELSEKAMAISEAYDSQYREVQLEKERGRSRLRQWIAILLSALLAVALLLLFEQIRHNRITGKKNQALASELDRMLQLQEEVKNMRKQAPPRQGNPRNDTESSVALFAKLEEIMDQERLYLKSELSRDDILKRLHVDKNRLALMFREVGQGFTLPTYINEKRLTHSLKLLRIHPYYTIETIAFDSGFSSSRYYHHLFKERYGITPSEYLRSVQKEKEKNQAKTAEKAE